ncbi:MAG: ribosome maturation factor RimP [Pseudomonadota bacterium]
METLERRIADLAGPVAADLGFDLVRIRVSGAKRKTVQVMAERPDGAFSIDDCAALSRALSAVFEVDDPIRDAYTLEVSSPGVDRPLVRPRDFERWAGHAAKLELDRMIEGRKRFKGVLAGFEDDNVLIDLEGEEETALIPIGWVASAKLMMTDELMKQSMKDRATPPGDAAMEQSKETSQ